jgi:hypothetical protein
LLVLVSDPDQSITKGSRFKYRQKSLTIQLMTKLIQSDCYDLLYDFVEETVLMQQCNYTINNIIHIIYTLILYGGCRSTTHLIKIF